MGRWDDGTWDVLLLRTITDGQYDHRPLFFPVFDVLSQIMCIFVADKP